jgi:hypothetical protein
MIESKVKSLLALFIDIRKTFRPKSKKTIVGMSEFTIGINPENQIPVKNKIQDDNNCQYGFLLIHSI